MSSTNTVNVVPSNGGASHIFSPPNQINTVNPPTPLGSVQSSPYYNDPSHIGVVNNGYNIEPIHYPETTSGPDQVNFIPNPNQGPIPGTPFVPKQRDPTTTPSAPSKGKNKDFWDKNKSWLEPTLVGVGTGLLIGGITLATGGADLAVGGVLAEAGLDVGVEGFGGFLETDALDLELDALGNSQIVTDGASLAENVSNEAISVFQGQATKAAASAVVSGAASAGAAATKKIKRLFH